MDIFSYLVTRCHGNRYRTFWPKIEQNINENWCFLKIIYPGKIMCSQKTFKNRQKQPYILR